ncbi:MAG: ergothioneine biosynthesis protein EgtB [Gammaproteobacteria bacterium]|nr:ergothioneine biosynthesis protein EgtB [Gammaproteobacteria bacterium]NIR83571.1 ergothioneine biosynthesis protein EgtB [Gammaproteobacteria bacterium]NIR91493.1 ergothioneine biosynthesis protein EgtB [Gammaproteobacteria bacterium]NIU04733.1 ergothioneine biosynthesis protein EgtB [Gammaproteobacteria bacterium]NIV51775.1 ergothioneine biosynthesis protein EgtB [Gammaproteobacteria bacterium]
MSLSSEALSVGEDFSDRLRMVRDTSVELCNTLHEEDFVVQSMPDVSPTKWHLAHTTWFFETFVLAPRVPGYCVFDERYEYLFNSYYYTVGQMHPRPRRGLLSRPTVAETMAYRSHVDAYLQRLMEDEQGDPELEALITLGLHHEQQHQELLLTDIKHVFAQNPLCPVFREAGTSGDARPPPMEFIEGASGLVEIGHRGDGFCFDNECPRHHTYLHPHALATRPVTNEEYLEFIRDGGYRTPELWLSDGWATVQREHWDRPLYWSEGLDSVFTLNGQRALEAAEPVSHVSYYEADAFTRWAGMRLPTEAEWEVAAESHRVSGNFMEDGRFHPMPAPVRESGGRPLQVFGDVWEWTASPYVPYPGFRPLAGAIGEYNGKFMCNQLVLRGGSCVTASSQVRVSYRNFFYPDQRWQFMGIRPARDA